jgi:hypothetical protein
MNFFLDQPRNGALNFFGVRRRREFFLDQPRSGALKFLGVWHRCEFFFGSAAQRLFITFWSVTPQ